MVDLHVLHTLLNVFFDDFSRKSNKDCSRNTGFYIIIFFSIKLSFYYLLNSPLVVDIFYVVSFMSSEELIETIVRVAENTVDELTRGEGRQVSTLSVNLCPGSGYTVLAAPGSALTPADSGPWTRERRTFILNSSDICVDVNGFNLRFTENF
jgi:hypothetical protein